MKVMGIYDKKEFFWHNIFSVIYLLMVACALAIFAYVKKLPSGISAFDFFILSLATFRLIRLFVYDSITEHIRRYLGQFEYGPLKEISDLINCPWCTGIWMALIISFFYFLTAFAWYPTFILALAGAATFIQITIIKIGKRA